MRYALNREQIRSYDRLATELCKVPGLILMENAGSGAARIIRELIRTSGIANPRIAIVCGTGNNGGDGFVVARHLSAMGFKPDVFLQGDASGIHGDALMNFLAIDQPDCSLEKMKVADFIIDALFGTGLSRNIGGELVTLIETINRSPAMRIALDISSGLDADRGVILGAAIQAHHTITFAHPKIGLFTPQGKNQSGELHCISLGVPDEKILAQTGFAAQIISENGVAENFRPRAATTYKHKAGDLLIVAGSAGKTGAAKLVAEAALRSGAGLATICTWHEALPAFEKELKEIMLTEIDAAQIEKSLAAALVKRSAIVIGPGFGLTDAAAHAVRYLLAHAQTPVVVDADALTLCAQNPEMLKKCAAAKILTPHSGELARLLKITAVEVEADRFNSARRVAEMTEAIVVLKGAHSIVADPSGTMWISAEVNPALATAGSGDILAGIIAAFAATLPPLEAATAGVFVHAAAARLWSERNRSDRGMLAGDIAVLLPEIIGKLIRK